MVNDISKQTVSTQNTQVASDVDIKQLELVANQKQPSVNAASEKQPSVNAASEKQPSVNAASEKQPSVNAASEKPSVSVVDDTVSRLNEAVQSIERDLKFRIDESSGDTIITVLDTKTEEVIRQIPTEDVLAVRENIETLKGILFSAKV